MPTSALVYGRCHRLLRAAAGSAAGKQAVSSLHVANGSAITRAFHDTRLRGASRAVSSSLPSSTTPSHDSRASVGRESKADIAAARVRGQYPLRQPTPIVKTVSGSAAAQRMSPSARTGSLSRIRPVTPGETSAVISGVLTSQATATNYIRTLQNITEPVLIYQAPSRRAFSAVCLSSTTFCAVLASFNYTQYAAVQNTTFLAAGICVSAMWVALGLYFANGPLHYIQSIRALPPTSEMRHARGSAAVLLDFELDSLFFFTKSRHSITTADKVTRDLSIAAGTQGVLQRQQIERLRFRWGAWFFRVVRTTMVAFIKMFTRRDTAYIALPSGTHWKVDLPGTRNLGRGGALEQLLRLDVSKRRGLRKLFGPDERPST